MKIIDAPMDCVAYEDQAREPMSVRKADDMSLWPSLEGRAKAFPFGVMIAVLVNALLVLNRQKLYEVPKSQIHVRKCEAAAATLEVNTQRKAPRPDTWEI